MENDNDTIEQVCADLRGHGLIPPPRGAWDLYANRITEVYKREKRKFEFELDIQKNLVAKLCKLLKEFESVLNDTKNYACFGCSIRGCPGEHECRYTKKYCLLVDKTRKAIEDVKGTQHIELTKKEI